MLSATIEQLRAVALGASDASGYFPAMYARVTERVQQATHEGRFGDGDRMVRFARAFAEWYLRPRAGTPPIVAHRANLDDVGSTVNRLCNANRSHEIF